MSQELEQAVKEAAAEYLRDYIADKRLLLEVEIEQVILKHLSPLFTRLSQRITEEWEERWSKDASQSESECRARDKRIEELEGAESKWREDFRIQNEHICKSNERIEELEAQAGAMRDAGEWKSLLAELVELRAWVERAKGVLFKLKAEIDGPGRLISAVLLLVAEDIDALLSSSAPGQALECLSHPGPAGEPLTEEERSRMGLVDGAWPADAGGKESQ